MKHAIMAAAGIALTTSLIIAGDASAGISNWGCIGQIGDRQIIFNRYHLVVVPGKPSRGKLADLLGADELAGPGDNDKYDATSAPVGLPTTLVFTRHGAADHRVTLTQKSSKLVSDREVHRCRDESTMLFRNVYSLRRDDEPAQDVTLQCEDHELSTRGGRKCH